ncbi:MAG TPA: TetR/AcrR family transcriptional regulator [Terriglobales bacterium]
MSGTASSLANLQARKNSPHSRAQAKRFRIIEVAMRHFAEHGYEAARVGDMADELGIAKGSIFQHFGSKEGLFLEVYKKAARSFSPYLNVPAEIRQGGFFEILRYWLVRTEHFVREDWIPYRVYLLGNYGTSLTLKREINRFITSEDPYGRIEFVRWGLHRGELRKDLDVEVIVSIVDWMVERFQDALVTEELDPGLFRRTSAGPEKKEARINQFLDMLRRAIGK